MHATEHARPDVAEARAAWQQTAPTWDRARLVFLDESGVRTDLVRRYGRGHRLTKPEAVDVAPGVRRSEPQVLGWYRRAKATKRGGMGGRSRSVS